MRAELVRPLGSIAWELRGAWATGKRVAVTLAGGGRVEGHVRHVAATDTIAVISGRTVEVDDVLAVHLPSVLGDSTWRGTDDWRGPALRVIPQEEQLPRPDGWGEFG